MGIPIVLGIVTLVFILVRLAPGDPIQIIVGDHATPQIIASLKAKYGFDQPIFVQWWRYIISVARGDFGVALTTNRDILPDLLDKLKYTLELMVGSMVVAIMMGIPVGILTAVKRNTWFDHGFRIFSLAGVSLPQFWFGILLLLLFAIKLDLFPVTGAGEDGNIVDILYHLILPSITLGLTFAAMISRITRTTMLEVLSEQYIVTAKAFGLPKMKVLLNHAFRNASIPVVTVIGVQIGRVVSMGLIVETVFSRPGLGTYMYQAILSQDYPAIQASIIFTSIIVVLVNITLDIAYAIMDPRIEL